MLERIETINIESLIPFENHPFKNRSGMEQTELIDSIRSGGLLEPLLVRPFSKSKYEIISGHRRVAACRELGMKSVPVIIRELTNEEAVIAMVDANLQRKNILPSEKAYAYRMKMEALSAQGKRTDLTCGQVGHKSRNSISNEESGRQIQRYIRLTYLDPKLLEKVDEGKIAFTPAVELSYLTNEEQKLLLNEIEYADATPSLSQSQGLQAFSRQGRLTIYAVMSEEKANQKEQIRLPKEEIQKYFPRCYRCKDMQNIILKLLKKWQRQRERQREER